MLDMRPEDLRTLVAGTLWLAGTGVALMIAWSVAHRRAQVKEGAFLPRIAKALGGELGCDASVEYPFIRLNLGETRAYFLHWMLARGSMKVVSTMEARFGVGGFLEATSFGSRRSPSRSRRLARMETGSRFHVVTSDLEWGEALFERLRPRLEAVREWAGHPTRVQLMPGRMTLEVEALLDAEGAMILRDHAGAFITALARMESAADRCVVTGHLEARSGRCPVCWSQPEGRRVLCAGCRAPYHSDCWGYVGKCAIFGCSSRQAA